MAYFFFFSHHTKRDTQKQFWMSFCEREIMPEILTAHFNTVQLWIGNSNVNFKENLRIDKYCVLVDSHLQTPNAHLTVEMNPAY